MYLFKLKNVKIAPSLPVLLHLTWRYEPDFWASHLRPVEQSSNTGVYSI